MGMQEKSQHLTPFKRVMDSHHKSALDRGKKTNKFYVWQERGTKVDSNNSKNNNNSFIEYLLIYPKHFATAALWGTD